MNDIVKFKGAALPTKGLGAGLKNSIMRAKDAVGVVGNTPFLRLTKGQGEWVYGAQNTYVEDNSLWAVNPSSFQIGFIAWKGGRPVGKKMRPISATPVTVDELPDVGAEWDVNVGFQLQCVYGEDEGTVVDYTANSYGGKKAFNDLLTALYKQAETDDINIVPIVELKSDSYVHPEWGTTYNPIFEVRKWVGYEGEQAAQAEPSPPPNGASTATVQPPQTPPGAASNGAAAPRRRAAPVTDVPSEPAQAEQPAKAPPGAPAEPVQRRRRRAAAPAA